MQRRFMHFSMSSVIIATSCMTMSLGAQSSTSTSAAVPPDSIPTHGAAPVVTPPTAPHGKPSHAKVGARVRLQYLTSTAPGAIERPSVVEGTLTAIDAERFTITLDNHDTASVSRRQAMNITVQERVAKRSAAIGVGLFSLFLGTAFTARDGQGEVTILSKWSVGSAIAGVGAVALFANKHWVPTTFPP